MQRIKFKITLKVVIINLDKLLARYKINARTHSATRIEFKAGGWTYDTARLFRRQIEDSLEIQDVYVYGRICIGLHKQTRVYSMF